jgi:hypothetical protein
LLRKWTKEEDTILREHYQGENRNKLTVESLCFYLERTPASISGRIASLKLCENRPRWSPEELEFLSENYGVLPADKIAKKLGRSVNALKIISYRKLGINQRSNIYTARNVAELVGVG